MPNKAFLETYPLYKKFLADVPRVMSQLEKPKLNFHCSVCRSRQTYLMVNEYYYAAQIINPPTTKYTLRIQYICGGCDEDFREYFVLVSTDLKWMMKVGQNPPWELSGDKNIERMLGSHKTYLSKGLICESQGYGMAAFAYYRRITEEIIDGLLGEIEGLMSPADKVQFQKVMEQVKTTRQTSEKIGLVKDLLPESLRIDGLNPLGILHSAVSEGLHARSDEECLNIATAVRETLVFLSAQISEVQRSKLEFTEKMRTLLQHKGNK